MNHLSLGKLNLLMVPVHLWITHPKPPSQKASHSRSSKRSFFSTEEYIAPRAANIHLTAQPLYPSTSDNPYYWQNSKNECSQAYILSETSIPSNILLLCFQQQQPRHNGSARYIFICLLRNFSFQFASTLSSISKRIKVI